MLKIYTEEKYRYAWKMNGNICYLHEARKQLNKIQIYMRASYGIESLLYK